VGTNVAADALSNLSSPGVTGGVLIVVGEDYGEGASVIQERTHAYALKSGMTLFDPRPDLTCMVDMVEHAFAISEASNMPSIMELRIRTCHVRGSFQAKNNQAPRISTRHLMEEPARFDYGKLAHPPVTFIQEKKKIAHRIPAAREYIIKHKLNEEFNGPLQDWGLVVQGGFYNTLIRSLQQFGLADAMGESQIPILVLNVTCPLVPDQLSGFCKNKKAVLVLEEGQPEYIEQEIATILRRQRIDTPLHGKDMLPSGGEYTAEVVAQGLLSFLKTHAPHLSTIADVSAWLTDNQTRRETIAKAIADTGQSLPPRPPGFCIGCPERPVFSAIQLAQQQVGALHIAADIGCHALGTFEPFSTGHTILGYGMSLASRAGVSPNMQRRVLSIMGDGGFWHNGLLTGVQSALFNGDDAVLLIFKNGYTSATGTQDIISTPNEAIKADTSDKTRSLAHTNQTIERTLEGLGVTWMKTVYTYEVDNVRNTLVDAFTSDYQGLKVIIAEGECQLERQRRIKPWLAQLLKRGQRVERVKYGVDEDVCNGDHACIRLSGCPTLTLKDNPDPLKVDPVATVIDGCVGCGLCGENAHAATLCPSFYRAEVIQNPKPLERLISSIRTSIVRLLQPA
jgi:indolepyruvate ferredoxin oxidoreductase alpha subunit